MGNCAGKQLEIERTIDTRKSGKSNKRPERIPDGKPTPRGTRPVSFPAVNSQAIGAKQVSTPSLASPDPNTPKITPFLVDRHIVTTKEGDSPFGSLRGSLRGSHRGSSRKSFKPSTSTGQIPETDLPPKPPRALSQSRPAFPIPDQTLEEQPLTSLEVQDTTLNISRESDSPITSVSDDGKDEVSDTRSPSPISPPISPIKPSDNDDGCTDRFTFEEIKNDEIVKETKKDEIDEFLENEAILPKVPTYEEAIRAQKIAIEESIVPQDEEEIEDDEEIIPIRKTYQEEATPLYKEPSSIGYSAGNVTPEVQTSAVSGQKFASLFDAPVVYVDSDEEIVLPDSKNIPIPTEYGAPAVKDGVRYEVNTTEELLRQVADSVEDVSYEQIQFEETLSDDTEVEIPDAQESEEESVLTDASDSEEDDEDTEFPSSGYTETGVTDSAEYPSGTGTDDQTDSNSFRAIDPSQPVSVANNSIKIIENETNIGQLPSIARVTINQEKVYQSEQSLISDSETILESETERQADDETEGQMTKAEELVDQLMEEIVENIAPEIHPNIGSQIKNLNLESMKSEDEEEELEDIDVEIDMENQSEVSIEVPSEFTDTSPIKVPLAPSLEELNEDQIFRPIRVYKDKAQEIAEDIIAQSIQIVLDQEDEDEEEAEFETQEDVTIDFEGEADFMENHPELNYEKHTGDFFLKKRFTHLSESARDSPLSFRDCESPAPGELEDEKHTGDLFLKKRFTYLSESARDSPIDYEKRENEGLHESDSEVEEEAQDNLAFEKETGDAVYLSGHEDSEDEYEDKYQENTAEEIVDEIEARLHMRDDEVEDELTFGSDDEAKAEAAEAIMQAAPEVRLPSAEPTTPPAEQTPEDSFELVHDYSFVTTTEDKSRSENLVQDYSFSTNSEDKTTSMVQDYSFSTTTEDKSKSENLVQDYSFSSNSEDKTTSMVLLQDKSLVSSEKIEDEEVSKIIEKSVQPVSFSNLRVNPTFDHHTISSKPVQTSFEKLESPLCYYSPEWGEEKSEDSFYTFMVEGPTYFENQVVQVEKCDFNFNGIHSRISHLANSSDEDELKEAKNQENIVFRIEGPEYHSDKEVQLKLEDVIGCLEDSKIEFCADVQKEMKEFDLPEAKKFTFCIDGPEYYPNRIFQVEDLEEIDALLIEDLIVDFVAENGDIKEAEEKPEAKKFTFCIEGPEYHPNNIFTIDDLNFDLNQLSNDAEIDFFAATEDSLEVAEGEPEDKKFTFCVEGPEYFPNKIFTLEDLEFDLAELKNEANVDFCAMSEEPLEKPEIEIPQSLVFCIEGPEYFTNRVFTLENLEDIPSVLDEDHVVNFIAEQTEDTLEEYEETSSDKIIMCLQNPEYFENQVLQADLANIEDSLEDAKIEYISSFNEKVEEDEVEESYIPSGPAVQPDVKKIVMCIKTPEYFDNLLVQIRAEDLSYNLKDAKVEYVGSAEEVESEIKAKADVDQREARLRVKELYEEMPSAPVDKVVFMVENPEYFENNVFSVVKSEFFSRQEESRIEFLVSTSEEPSERVEEVTEIVMISQPEETKSKKFTFMINTPEYHENSILEAEIDEDFESSLLTYFAETSEEVELEPEEIVVTAEISQEEKKIVFCLETPEYHDNQIFQTKLEDFFQQGENCNLEFVSFENEFPEDITEVIAETAKLVLCVETPEYHDNKIIQVDQEDFFKNHELTKVSYVAEVCEEPEEIESSNENQLIFFVETPEYQKNMIFTTLNSDFNYNKLQARLLYAADADAQVEEEISEAKQTEGLVLMIETPEYYENTMVQVCYEEFLEYGEESFVNFVRSMKNKEAEQIIMSSENEEEKKFKIRFAIETPSYFSNQQFEATFNTIEDIADLTILENSEVGFLTDLSSEIPSEDKHLEDIEVICSSPIKSDDKLILCLETPEYQDNIVVQVNREDFFKYPEMAKMDFKKFTEEVMIDDENTYEDLVFLLETPEYHKNILISTSKLDFDFNQLQARLLFAAEATEDINDEIKAAKTNEGLVLMIEGPEYYSNTLLQVCFEEFLSDEENAEVNFRALIKTRQEDLGMMKSEDKSVQKFEFVIKTPNYFNNQTFELEVEDISELEDLKTFENTELYHIGETEETLEDEPMKTAVILIETPEYQDNQLVEVEVEDSEDFEKSVVNFVADTEVKPEDEFEVLFGDPEYVTLLIETPEYQDNKIVSVKLEDLIMSEADLEGVEVEYVEDIDSSYDYEFPISIDLSEDDAARLKAELTSRLVHGFDFVLELDGTKLNEQVFYIDDQKNIVSGIEANGEVNYSSFKHENVSEEKNFEKVTNRRYEKTIENEESYIEGRKEENQEVASTLRSQLKTSSEVQRMLEDVEKLTKIRQTTKIPRAKILAKFEEINKMRSEIQKMDQTTIAEIRSMNEPPSEIKDIMKAVFVLLGEAPSKLETWTGIRALIGKIGPESLRRRICEFNPKSLINQEVTVKHAKSLCKNQSLFRVRRLSVGTAVFYSWCQITIDALEHYSDSLVRDSRDQELNENSGETIKEHKELIGDLDSTIRRGETARRGVEEPGDDIDIPINIENTEPGDDIDEDLVTIRIEEPEVSAKDLDDIMTKFNSFKDTSTDAILEKISKVDPSVKTEILKDGNDSIKTVKIEVDNWRASEPVYTFGKPKAPTFKIRSKSPTGPRSPVSPLPVLSPVSSVTSPASLDVSEQQSSKYVEYLEDDSTKTGTDIESVMSQINSEMNDALSIFDKSQFTGERTTSSGGKSGNTFGESQYEETNSFDSQEAVEDDCSRIVHKDYSYSFLNNRDPCAEDENV